MINQKIIGCLRCGNWYENPVPPVTDPKGNLEIATVEWCADCNALCMSLVHRGSSAYDIVVKLKGAKDAMAEQWG